MSPLSNLIETSLRQCNRKRGWRRTVQLKSGLRLTLYVDEAGENHLLLQRLLPVWPGEREIETVMDHWPLRPTPRLPWQPPGRLEGPVIETVERQSTKKYNCIFFHWKPLTPQPFARIVPGPSTGAEAAR